MEEIVDNLEDSEIIINNQDGLPHATIYNDYYADPSSDYFNRPDGLSTSLIVTNINSNVFLSRDEKDTIENLFRIYDPNVTFQWLRSFKRLRVNFETPIAATNARLDLHHYQVNDSLIACYFAQPVFPVKNSSLQPPAPYKQFLISPPASPPLDWEPRPEGEPIINNDLLAALASLAPGGSQQIHPPTPGQPSIVVHSAIDGACSSPINNAKPRIIPVARPEF